MVTQAQEVFQRQPNAGVVQDNKPPGRLTAASQQPVTAKSPAVTTTIDPVTVIPPADNRPKHHGSETRQLELIAGRVPPHIKSEVNRIAKLKGWTPSKTVAWLVEQALARTIAEQFGVMMRQTIQEAVRQEFQIYTNRMGKLQFSGYMAAEQGRLMQIDNLRHQLPPKDVANLWSRTAIKAHLRYIIHRPGKAWETRTRELFQHEYLPVTKQDAYDRINTAPRNTLFYKMMINFHPQKEDTYKDLDLHYIASLTVREMQYRLGREVPFFATIHHGHATTDLRHIHAICLVQGRLSKAEYATLQTLWQTATAEVKEQRKSRDRVHDRHRTQFLAQAQVLYQSPSAQQRSLYQADAPRKKYRRFKPLRIQPGCYSCGYGQLGDIPAWYDFCPCCHKPLNQDKTLQLELSRQL